MSYYNNYKSSRRIRGRSCPAGVCFEINDIKNAERVHQRRSISFSNPCVTLTKEINTSQKRRSSLPSVMYVDLELASANLNPRHLLNNSFLAGGAHNSFWCKLDGTVSNNHSSIDISHQHKEPNKFGIKKRFSTDRPSSRVWISRHVPKETIKVETLSLLGPCDTVLEQESIVSDTAFQFIKTAVTVQGVIGSSLPLATAEQRNPQKSSVDSGSKSNKGENGGYDLKIEHFGEELESSNVTDLYDKGLQWLLSKQVIDPGEFNKDVENLECHVHGAKLPVGSLESQVADTRREFKMSKKKQESELSDLLSLNEEMQTIWSEKESEVREILERFSAYRDAVEADSKEKDELYVEELKKREIVIRELELSKNNLEEKLSRKEAIIEQVIKDRQQTEAARLQELLEIDELVTGLAGKFMDSDMGSKAQCCTISTRLKSVIAGFEDEDFAKYPLMLDLPRQGGRPGCDLSNVSCMNSYALDESRASTANKDELTPQLLTGGEEKQNSQSTFQDNESRAADEQFALSEDLRQLASPAENISSHVGVEAGHAALYEITEDQFQDEVPNFHDEIGSVRGKNCSVQDGLFREISKAETLEEDLVKWVKRMEEKGIEGERNPSDEEDGLMEAYVERKAVVRLLEEQLTGYQLICREKDDEIEHWKKKHKHDTKNLQDILEEQERAEMKNREALTELELEIDKLRRRNKTLESEVELAKEQGEDEVCVLRENFQKDLTHQLNRQSKSFLSVEEASRSRVAELERKNEELLRGNEDLRRQIADHCAEIKSWVIGILLLTEEEYQEEFHSISDVLAKLQKIIVDNKRTICKLEDQLNEHASATNDPGETLSHSWGGYSWNSVDSQRELCRNCRQTKWKHVLMGSFDMVESGLEVKQDEIERFLTKIDTNESKSHKRQSLKDSLELAEVQTEFIQRLGAQNWSSLGNLSEGSFEEGSFSESGVKGFETVSCVEPEEKGSRIPSLDAEHPTILENDMEEIELQSCGVHLGNIDQKSVLLTPEEAKELERCDLDFDKKFTGMDRPEENEGNGEKGRMEKTNSDKDEESVVERKEDEKEEARHEESLVMKKKADRGLVEHMVNREENCEKEQSKMDGEGGYKDVELGGSEEVEGDGEEQTGDSEEEEDNSSEREDVSEEQQSDAAEEKGDSEEHVGDIEGEDDDNEDLVHVVNLYRSLVIGSCSPRSSLICKSTSDSSALKNEKVLISPNEGVIDDGELMKHEAMDDFNNQQAEEQHQTREERVSSNPKVVFKKDYNENLPGIYVNNVKGIDYNADILKDWKRFDCLHPKGFNKGKDANQHDGKGGKLGLNEVKSSKINHSKCKISQSLKVNGNFEKSANDIPEKVQSDNIPTGSCPHCTTVFKENAAVYEKSIEKLLELKSQQAQDYESQILRELEERKADVRRYQQQYEDLEKVCDEHRKRIDEYSQKIRNKNSELRKIKLSSSIMKTEVEWLRQALGITRGYCELGKDI